MNLPSPPPSPVLYLHGDSFASVFSLLGPTVKVFKYKGASARGEPLFAQGLDKVDSKLGIGEQLVARLESARPSDVLLQFGAVDLHINYLWQLKARGREASDPQEWVQKVANDYSAFLTSQVVPFATRSGIKVYIAAASPPVVEDSYLEAAAEKYISKNGVVPLMPLCLAAHPHNLATRSAMVHRFNALLGAFCAMHDCLSLVDISRHLGDPRDATRVASEFVDQIDPTNVHLLWEPTLPHWVRALPPLAHLAPSLASPEAAERLARGKVVFEREKRERMRMREREWAGVGGTG
ncbi:hypothetical protein DMC30DRAFT_419190 [Rhodotorula diobovata]|uniref:Uncharacterized protein n=1 Tax=Rhodotorula diobovata TaxID=5288 RepID=A0A5C5FN39_9BASI|nr:hypothetical protein DMC30DRAFT_419190 [Rhodotorula diobovata]